MTPDEFKKLYGKYMLGKCTPEEEQLIEAYRDNFDLSEMPWDEKMGDPSLIEKEVTQDIHDRLNAGKVRRLKLTYWSAAASIFIISGIFLYLAQRKPIVRQHFQAVVIQPIKPGTNKAILTLANGRKIVLDDAKKGTISKQNNISITKNTDGEVVYQKSNTTDNGKPVENVITTPRGGQYTVVLADGTKVFLNSASTLTYPAGFSGSERNVTLTGEAYFEVAKNPSMAFKVNVAGRQKVEVLGTHFNISAYPDDNDIKTTLLEGSVRLSNQRFETMLKPGEMAIQDSNSLKVRVAEADIEEAVAWKNGYFKFRKQHIRDIMKKVSRWYNVDVVYEGPVTNRTFGGIYLRSKTLPGILDLLEYTGSVHFKVNERRITVMP